MASAVFETLHSLLVMCLEQSSTGDLARLILIRLEAQFGTDLVRNAFCYLEASRFGMSEVELIHALQINQTEWMPLFAGVRGMLNESAGLFNVSSHQMQVAIRARYFNDESTTRDIHRALIAFFNDGPSEHVSEMRCCMELPFQMMQANELRMLDDFLVDIGHVRYLLTDASLARDLTDFWVQSNQGKVPEDLGPRYMESMERYGPVLRKEVTARCEGGYDEVETAYHDLLSKLCAQVGTFLCTFYQYAGAAALHERALEIDRGRFAGQGMSERVAESMRRLANSQYLLGRYEPSMKNFTMALAIYNHLLKKEPSLRVEYAQTLFEMASVARYTEDPSRARVQCLVALRTFREMLGEDNPRVASKA